MKPTKKVTPKDSSFDAADYDVPIEVEAYNNGVNETIDEYEAWLKHIKWIVVEDVPHKYQTRLLEALEGK